MCPRPNPSHPPGPHGGGGRRWPIIGRTTAPGHLDGPRPHCGGSGPLRFGRPRPKASRIFGSSRGTHSASIGFDIDQHRFDVDVIPCRLHPRLDIDSTRHKHRFDMDSTKYLIPNVKHAVLGTKNLVPSTCLHCVHCVQYIQCTHAIHRTQHIQ